MNKLSFKITLILLFSFSFQTFTMLPPVFNTAARIVSLFNFNAQPFSTLNAHNTSKMTHGRDQNNNPLCNRPHTTNFLSYPQEKYNEKLIRLFTYNLRYLHPDDTDTQNEWSKRLTRITTLLKHYKPDIISFQEVYPNTTQITDLQKNLQNLNFISWGDKTGSSLEISSTNPSKKNEEFVGIAYDSNRFCVNKSGYFWPSENNELFRQQNKTWDEKYPRIVIWCDLFDKKTKKQFIASTSHLDTMGAQSRFNTIPLIINTLKKLEKRYIFSGDFNLWPHHSPNAQETYMQFINNKMQDIRDISKKHYGPDGTWIGFDYDNFKAPENDLASHRLDHMFVSPGVDIHYDGVIADRIDEKSGEIIFQSLENEHVDKTGLMASDHAILAADFTIE